MKRKLTLLVSVLLYLGVQAQTSRSKALELRSHYSSISGTETLTIYWPKDTSALSYKVFRRDQNNIDWNLLSNLNTGDSSVVIPGYQQGKTVDIWVVKKRQIDSASGYIHAGENVYQFPNTGAKDILLLLIDSNYVQPLSSEIARLVEDLNFENWEVRQHVVQRDDTVQNVKSWIEAQWQADSTRIQSVYLLGHVPVPYSGNFNPDAHPEHQGAWPADVYYTTFDLNWTDQTVNTTTAARTANHNVPGDNKFDQDYIWPARAQIPLGRVDLFDMPAFGNDTFLMRQYLDKNHAFRIGKMKAENRALIEDNFDYFGGEAFAANGWRAFTPIFGAEVYEKDYFNAMGDSSYLFSYGCGAGTYTSAGGIGSSTDFANDSLLNPFTMLFGSYFGDWDNSNNFLKAPLASKGWGLASAWAGRPFWMFHHAALNQPIGRAAMETQNAYPDYDAGYSGTYVHTALMGDPSLRLFVLAPPVSFKDSPTCDSLNTKISWDVLNTRADSVHVVIKDTLQNIVFDRLMLAADSSFDILLTNGRFNAQIQSKQWVRNPSGNFPIWSHPMQINVYVNDLPQAGFTQNKTYSCSQDSFAFLDTSIASNYTRNWLLNGQSIGGAPFAAATIDRGTHTITLRIEDNLGCVAMDSHTIYVAPELKSDSFLIRKTTSFPACDGSNNTFDAYASFLPKNASMLWFWGDSTSGEGQSTDSVFFSQHELKTKGTYTGAYYVYDSTGLCSTKQNFSTTIYPIPNQPSIEPSPIILSRKDTNFRSEYYPDMMYHWSTSLPTTITTFDSAHKVNINFGSNVVGFYGVFLFLENQGGCLSDTTIALVNYLASVSPSIENSWSLYPNPTKGRITVQLENPEPISNWTLYDMSGKSYSIQVEERSAQEFQIDMSQFAPGTYMLIANTESVQLRGRVVKRE